jgi:sn-glycerol 3-phosphate transport system permease protein
VTDPGEAGAPTVTADLAAADVVLAGSPARPRRIGRRMREAGLGYLLVLPSFVIFAVFIFFPFLKNFWLGLYRNPPFPNQPRVWAGFEQYSDILTSSEFSNSVRVTLLFALFTVPAGIALGLALAVLAHQRLRGVGIYRTIFSSSVATSVAVASVIFGTLMNPKVGLLPWLGLDPKPEILRNPDRVYTFPEVVADLPIIGRLQGLVPTTALLAVSVTTIWQNLGLSFILMSAGLQAVPDELLEVAQVDGAGPWSRFRRVTLPLLSPTLFFAVVVGTIFAFQSFGQIDLLTEGGPLDRTNVLTYFIFTELNRPDPGSAAVLAIALFGITLLLTIVQMRVLERRVFYAG